jgi:hypothetical protein
MPYRSMILKSLMLISHRFQLFLVPFDFRQIFFTEPAMLVVNATTKLLSARSPQVRG